MVDTASANNDDRPQTSDANPVPDSVFKIYLEQNPEMAAKLFQVMLQLYQEPMKQSETAAHVLSVLNVEEDECDADALKLENKEMRHQIFELHEQVRKLEDDLAEIKEDSI